MNKGKIQLFGILTLLATSIILGGNIYIKSSEIKEQKEEAERLTEVYESGNSFTTFLTVEVVRNDEVVYFMEKENDLILSNLAYFFEYCFKGTTSLKDDQGQTSSSPTWGSVTTTQNDYIAIGTGTTAPTISDYILETEVTRRKIYDRSYSESGNQMNVTLYASWTSTGTYAITEAGLCSYFGDMGDEVFMTRDTFTAVNVVADDTINLSITFQFN